MRFLILDVQTLNAKERHVVFPYVIATFIMQVHHFYFFTITSLYNTYFPLQ